MLIIRSYDPRDWPAVQDVHDAARLIELTLSVDAHAFRSLSEIYVDEQLFDSTVWMAELEGRVVGFVAVNEDELTWLYVHPASHRTGVGRRLLEHALAAIDGEATAWVLAGNEPALRLYKSAGFRVVETKAGHLSGSPDIPATGYCLRRANGRSAGCPELTARQTPSPTDRSTSACAAAGSPAAITVDRNVM
jgi:ribosomal protein S18 acetylase RimI-like enzyme